MQSIGIAAAVGLSVALGLYARKRFKANRSDTDEYVRVWNRQILDAKPSEPGLDF